MECGLAKGSAVRLEEREGESIESTVKLYPSKFAISLHEYVVESLRELRWIKSLSTGQCFSQVRKNQASVVLDWRFFDSVQEMLLAFEWQIREQPKSPKKCHPNPRAISNMRANAQHPGSHICRNDTEQAHRYCDKHLPRRQCSGTGSNRSRTRP